MPEQVIEAGPAPDAPGVAALPRGLVMGGLTAVGVLLVLVVVLAVAVIRQPHSHVSERQAALAAARQAAVDFGSYDYHHAAADFARMAKESTGKTMTDQIHEALTTLVPAIKRLHGTSTATVLSAGLLAAPGGGYQVVAAVDENVTNTAVPNGDQHRYRFLIDMTKVDGRWLVRNLQQA